MTILVVGASGATGRLLVEQLLNRGKTVRVIVREPGALPERLRDHPGLSVTQASVLDLGDAELVGHVSGCEAIASCLGHNLSFKGMYGQPRKLVTDATRRLCEAVRASKPDETVKFVLMNTTGNRNRDLPEPISFAQKCVIGLIRVLVSPHVDNEQAAEYLRVRIGQGDELIKWSVVRPDSLIDEDNVTGYAVYASPIRSAIFDAGKTSRINVAHFIADLITEPRKWSDWKGQMPVLYNHSN
jgi:hypothetical protein